jgi:hypothetical protein
MRAKEWFQSQKSRTPEWNTRYSDPDIDFACAEFESSSIIGQQLAPQPCMTATVSFSAGEKRM